jgi:hypothetical protein
VHGIVERSEIMEKKDLCNCGSNYIFVKDGVFFCSYCKKPTGIKRSDIKPMTNEEITKLAKEVGAI